jgi:hypothetical protein
MLHLRETTPAKTPFSTSARKVTGEKILTRNLTGHQAYCHRRSFWQPLHMKVAVIYSVIGIITCKKLSNSKNWALLFRPVEPYGNDERRRIVLAARRYAVFWHPACKPYYIFTKRQQNYPLTSNIILGTADEGRRQSQYMAVASQTPQCSSSPLRQTDEITKPLVRDKGTKAVLGDWL